MRLFSIKKKKFLDYTVYYFEYIMEIFCKNVIRFGYFSSQWIALFVRNLTYTFSCTDMLYCKILNIYALHEININIYCFVL